MGGKNKGLYNKQEQILNIYNSESKLIKPLYYILQLQITNETN